MEVTSQINLPCIADEFQSTSGLLYFKTGDTVGTPFRINITITDDQVVELDTKFFFELDSTDQVSISPNSSKEINILDDDSKFVTFAEVMYGD